MTRKVYTDGSCENNPGPGGWAWVEYDGDKSISQGVGCERHTTNNKMELMAVIKAMENFQSGKTLIYTDSQYVCNGVNTWLAAWKRRGWKRSNKKPVLNLDLWKRLDGLLDICDVRFHWVKGHAKNPGNNLADELAYGQATKASSMVAGD